LSSFFWQSFTAEIPGSGSGAGAEDGAQVSGTQHPILGATDLGFVRSVLDLGDFHFLTAKWYDSHFLLTLRSLRALRRIFCFNGANKKGDLEIALALDESCRTSRSAPYSALFSGMLLQI
jgi:hypothetical protein